MRNLVNSDQAYTNLVQKYIGSAFDIVRAVAEHLEQIGWISESIDNGDLQKVAAMAEESQDLLAKLVLFHNAFYGSLEKAPLTRPDGTEIKDGDLYYDTGKGGLHVRENGAWVPVGGIGNTLQVITVEQSMFQGLECHVTLDKPYNPGTHGMMVFVNATYQYPITPETPEGAYVEVSPTEIMFTGGTVEEGDVLTFMIGNVVTSTEHVVSVNIEHYQTRQLGEKVVELPGGMSYLVGMNNLEVYLDGVHQLANIHYFETDDRHITFAQGLPQGALVTFKQGHVLTSGYAGGTGGTGFFEILNVVSEFFTRGHILRKDSLVFLLGHSRHNDGGAGMFVYDPAYDRAEANGGTVVDATVPLDQQGTGTGLGCWVRQYAERIQSQWWGVENALVKNLSALGDGQEGDVISLLGYHDVGDGGEGEFYWSETEPKRNHDGGFIIDPSQAYPQQWNDPAQTRAWYQSTSGGQGCWKRMYPSNASISWFGAKGDNTTDNSLVLEGIAAAVQRGDVRELMVPAGEFAISGTGHFEVDGLTTSFRLYGEGESSVLRCRTGAAQMPIIFRNSQGVEVNAVRFTDERRTAGNNGLTLMNCSDVLVHRCYFDGISNYAVAVTEDTIGNTSTQCNNIRIENNQFVRCGPSNGGAVLHAPKTLSQNVTIDNNYMTHCGGPTSAALEAGMATFGATITNNYLDASLGDAIKVAAYENITVSDNKIEDFGSSGIFVHAGTSPQYNAPTLTNCEIVRNNISLIDPANPQGDYGVKIEGNIAALGLLLVSNNTFYECAGISIEPQAVLQNIVITANKIQNIPANLFGLFVGNQKGGGAENLYVAENYIENENAAKNAVMVSLTNAPDVLFERNHIKRSGTTDILLNNCNDAHILNNTFFEPNITKTATIPVIQISDARTVDYTIARNMAITGRRGQFNAWTNIAAAPPTIHDHENIDIK